MDKEPRFICRLELNGPFAAQSITPPDSEFLAATVKGASLHDFSITGLDTRFLKIEATGQDATTRLEAAFRRHFTWGNIYQMDTDQ